MFYKINIRSVMLHTALSMCLCFPAIAKEGSGPMAASILDPISLNAIEAKQFCEEEPHTVKCEILEEQLREEQTDLEHYQAALSYDVLSVNFE